MNAHELFHAGKLREALAVATDAVRQSPTDAGRRLFLAELLCFSGDLERADNHLDALAGDDPQMTAGVVAFRQLIRAEQIRQGVFAEGRVPSVLGTPEGALRLALEASTRVREGATAEAAALAGQVEEARAHPSGICDGSAFDDFRDLDDITACTLELLTLKGDYYWVPLDRVESIEFHEPARPRDLIWRRAQVSVREGPEAEVFVPVLYPGAALETDDAIRLGRVTEWRGGDGSPVRGAGQRTYLVGEEARPILEIKSVSFDSKAPEEPSSPESV